MRSGILSREILNLAEAETVVTVEGNTLCTVMQGATALPRSETPLRMEGKRRNFGRPRLAQTATAGPGHDGKPRRRSRRGRGEDRTAASYQGSLEQSRPQIGGGDGGGKAAGRRKASSNARPGTQCRMWRVTEVASLRIGGAWAAKAPNLDRVRPSAGARCGKAARRDLRGGAGATRSPTATRSRATGGIGHTTAGFACADVARA